MRHEDIATLGVYMDIYFSSHAKEQLADRDIPIEMVLEVVKNPEQKYNYDTDETICQSRVIFGEKTYLLRVFMNFTKTPPVVISVYRTSKILKYWRDL